MMTMSVELAIQRELAYRAKLAKMLQPHDATVLQDLIPLEGQTSTGSSNSSPTLSEITWQAPTNDLKFNLPPPQLHEIENQTESSSFKVQTTSPSPSPRPYSSPSPVISGTGRLPSANSIKFSPPLQLHENDNQIDYTFCKVQSSSSNPNQMETSSWSPLLSGLKRPNSTSSLKFQSPPQHHEPGNQIDCSFCKICQVPCTSFFNYKQHIRGRKHQGKQQELKLKEQLEDKKSMDEQAESKFAKKVGIDSEMAKPKYWCKLCNIWCIDNDALTRHNEGKKHILKLHEIEKKRATLAGLATNRT